VVLCPSISPFKIDDKDFNNSGSINLSAYSWRFNTFASHRYNYEMAPGATKFIVNSNWSTEQEFLNITKLESPSTYAIIADSMHTNDKKQFYAFLPRTLLNDNIGGYPNGGGVAVAHNNRADLLMADGHVDTPDKGRLKQLGIMAWVEGDGSPHWQDW